MSTPHPLAAPAPETPSEDAVNAADLLADLAAYFTRYVVLPPGGADVLALFSAYTYVFDCFDTSPLLAITSPVKQCGKTRTQDLLEAVVRRPERASHMSTAVIFRLIEEAPPTLLLDEYDTYLTAANNELRGLIDGGFTRWSAQVWRCVGDAHKPTSFSTWCPKVLAGLNRLPATVEDRAILVPMQRASAPVTPLSLATLRPSMLDVRRRLLRWALDADAALRGASPARLGAFSDRANDCWRPLLAIADVAGSEWPTRARDAAHALARAVSANDETDTALLLLRHVREAFVGRDFLTSEQLVAALNARDDGPWAESGPGGRELTKHRLARHLASFGITPSQARLAGAPVRGYARAAFEPSWETYLSARTVCTDPVFQVGTEKV